MANIDSNQAVMDGVSNSLLKIAAAVRSGEIIGVTVVTTTNAGKVDMDALLLPGGTAQSMNF